MAGARSVQLRVPRTLDWLRAALPSCLSSCIPQCIRLHKCASLQFGNADLQFTVAEPHALIDSQYHLDLVRTNAITDHRAMKNARCNVRGAKVNAHAGGVSPATKFTVACDCSVRSCAVEWPRPLRCRLYCLADSLRCACRHCCCLTGPVENAEVLLLRLILRKISISPHWPRTGLLLGCVLIALTLRGACAPIL